MIDNIVKYSSVNVEMPRLYRNAVKTWIKEVAENFDKKLGQINYIFCDNKKILEVNQEFLKHDYFTDVITFDYSEKDVISGDIFISTETIQANADEYLVSFESELKRVMIHGILHLCGLKDDTPEQQEEMRRQEDIALSMI